MVSGQTIEIHMNEDDASDGTATTSKCQWVCLLRERPIWLSNLPLDSLKQRIKAMVRFATMHFKLLESTHAGYNPVADATTPFTTVVLLRGVVRQVSVQFHGD